MSTGPGPDGTRTQHEGGAATGAAGLDVDDGHPGHAQARQHLVPRGHAAVGGGAEGGLEAALAQARLGQGGPDGGDPHVGDGAVFETAEGVDADPGHVDAVHGSVPGAKA